MQQFWCVLVCTALVLPVAPVSAQPPAQDPEVAQGVKLVEDGEYDAAILTLDRAARRLAQDPKKLRDASQAYLYLGIAYIGKGQEAAAKARFREALQRASDLTLSAEQFPPKVINAFEAAKAEIAQASAVPEPATATAAPPTPSTKKKGSKLPLILGGVAAVGGGVALAAGGGGGSSAAAGGGNLARFYGTYSVIFTGQRAECGGSPSTLVLSGNPDGSNFQIVKSWGSITFTGALSGSGDFTGTGGGFMIRGQTTGSRISGNESQQVGSCTWTFDGSR